MFQGFPLSCIHQRKRYTGRIWQTLPLGCSDRMVSAAFSPKGKLNQCWSVLVVSLTTVWKFSQWADVALDTHFSIPSEKRGSKNQTSFDCQTHLIVAVFSS